MMGIDIENYRLRIGTFQPSGIKSKLRGNSNKKQFQYFMNFASRNCRRKTTLSDIFVGMGFYLVILTLVCGNASNTEISNHCKPLLNNDIPSYTSPSNGCFVWKTKKEMNKIWHMKDGNKRNPGYKYFSWNCDRGFISENK